MISVPLPSVLPAFVQKCILSTSHVPGAVQPWEQQGARSTGLGFLKRLVQEFMLF